MSATHCACNVVNDSIRDEFERLTLRSRADAHRLAFRLVRNAVVAEDIVQDALVSAWLHFSAYDRSRPFEAWLHRIVINVAFKRHARMKRLPVCSIDTGMEIGSDGAPLPYDCADQTPDPQYLLL